jgi:hypothetical protein
MPVNVFFEEFIPAAPSARPQGDFPFSKNIPSQNETEFVNVSIFIDVQILTVS